MARVIMNIKKQISNLNILIHGNKSFGICFISITIRIPVLKDDSENEKKKFILLI